MKVADMTVDELRRLVREVVEDVLAEREDEGPDPDEGLELRPEFEAELRQSLANPGPTSTLDEVVHRLGIRA